MTLDDFLDNLHRADFQEVRDALLTRSLKYAVERAQWYQEGNAGGPHKRTGTLHDSNKGVITSTSQGVLRNTARSERGYPYVKALEAGKGHMKRPYPSLAPAMVDTYNYMPRLWPPIAKKFLATLVSR
jgi:hypothetical protein